MDGMLTPGLLALGWAISIPFIGYSMSKIKLLSNDKETLMPILAALVFAAQMVNWYVPGGSTAHLVGAALLTIVLGPFAGVISMTTILIVQSLLFGDGGILSLGINIFNMGIIGCVTAHTSYKALHKLNQDLACFLSAWLSVFLPAIAVGIELGISAPIFGFGLSVAVPIMGLWHAILGVPEGIITLTAIRWLRRGGYLGQT